jgi:GTP-binding protein HflX
VLEDLGLSDIPRILVYNKTDLLDPFDVKLLEKTQSDAVFLSATHRDSTRALIERIAQVLAERWDKSAKAPSMPTGDEDSEVPPSSDEVAEMTTLEEMLRAAGKRTKTRLAN